MSFDFLFFFAANHYLQNKDSTLKKGIRYAEPQQLRNPKSRPTQRHNRGIVRSICIYSSHRTITCICFSHRTISYTNMAVCTMGSSSRTIGDWVKSIWPKWRICTCSKFGSWTRIQSGWVGNESLPEFPTWVCAAGFSAFRRPSGIRGCIVHVVGRRPGAATHHPSTHRTGPLFSLGEGFSAGSCYQG